LLRLRVAASIRSPGRQVARLKRAQASSSASKSDKVDVHRPRIFAVIRWRSISSVLQARDRSGAARATPDAADYPV